MNAAETQNLTDAEIKQLNEMERYLSFVKTWWYEQFVRRPERIIALFSGNQVGKTAGIVRQYVDRILGLHPVADKNVLYFECRSRVCPNLHRNLSPRPDMLCKKCSEPLSKFSGHMFSPYQVPKGMRYLTDGEPTEKMDCPHCKTPATEHRRETRIFRFCSETLPQEKENTSEDGQSAEIKNTVYPALKKWLPSFLIKRDITFRNPSIAIHDPFGRGDIIIEFTSYNQPIMAGAGVQRLSVFEDEEAPKGFHDEQLPRLLAENGDLIIGLTPANGMSWTFDEIFEKASIYIRTEAMAKYLEKPQIEKSEASSGIAVIQAATDDNPMLDKRTIEKMFENYEDPDVYATRRYGIHKQSTGRIHSFYYPIHFIDREKYFPDPPGMFPEWLHARMEDYHQVTNLAIVWIALSQFDEAFVYQEWNPSPEKFVTYEVARGIADRSKDYRYHLNLIDPLAGISQGNTGLTVIDDMNRHMKEFKINGIGTGGYWQAWDTKSTKGRDEVRKRLKNAVECQVPFNNLVKRDGREVRLPTLWVLNNCKETARSLKQWRKDEKGEPEQRYSHFNMCLEGVFKHPMFRPRRMERPEQPKPLGLFQGRR